MSKKFRQDEPVVTAQGTGRICSQTFGPKAIWGVKLDASGEVVELPSAEVFKRGTEVPAEEVVEEPTQEGEGGDNA